MPNYKTMYFNLAARVADAIDLLAQAQQAGEESYADAEEQPVLRLAKNPDSKQSLLKKRSLKKEE